MSNKAVKKKTLAKRKKPLKSPPVKIPEINLDNLESSRNALAVYIKQYSQGKIKAEKARTMAYLFSHYLAFLRAEAELKIMDRLQTLEEKVYELRKSS